MFAQSYDPFGCNHPPSPRQASEKHKREESARRQRMIEADRRYRFEEERLRLEEGTHQVDMRQQQEEVERNRHRRFISMLTQRDGEDMIDETLSFPPPFIYATLSKSNDEMDRVSTSLPPRTISVRTDSAIASNIKKQVQLRRSTDSSTICTEISNSQEKYDNEKRKEYLMNVSKSDDDDDALAPPHIIAEDDDLSDNDKEDEESLDSVWMHSAPGPAQLEPSALFQTYE